jgi:hypothetical protein
VSLEIGLAQGISSLFICEALAEVGAERHIIIDPFQVAVPEADFPRNHASGYNGHWKGIGLYNLKKAGYEGLVEFHGEMSYAALPRLVAEGRRVDFAFIDGSHLFDYALVDFFYVDMMLKPGGVMVLHDTWHYPAVRKLCRYMLTNRRYTVYAAEGGVPSGTAPGRRLAFDIPIVSRYIKEIAKPEEIEPDSRLGLTASNCTAFRKEEDDSIGDGSGGSRRWDFHREF